MISLIIVDYRTIPKTINYIQECFRTFAHDTDTHVLIVDNNEDEQIGLSYLENECHATVQRLLETKISVPLYECKIDTRIVMYIAARENLGYARGNNLGAQVGDFFYQDAYYLFSNNDLKFVKPFNLNMLLKPMLDDRNIAAVGPKIISTDNKQQSPRKEPHVITQLFAYYWGMLLPKGIKLEKYISDIDYGASAGKCGWVTGSFLVVDAAKFFQVEGFDEHTFLFYEEIILATRLQKKKYYMYYNDAVEVIHAHGETVKAVFSVMKSIDISFQSSIYYFKNYRHLSKSILALAYGNYMVFKLLFRLKKTMGSSRWLRKELE